MRLETSGAATSCSKSPPPSHCARGVCENGRRQKRIQSNLSSALKIGEAISAKPVICNAHKTQIYKHHGDFDRALWHFEKFHYTKEGIWGDAQSKLLRSLQVIQETDAIACAISSQCMRLIIMSHSD
ncbi:MAG: hypothetical protein SNJ66_08705 [Chloroherpetonaceae bacterium]